MASYSNSRDFDAARIRRNEHMGLDANGNRFGEGTAELAEADLKKELESARTAAKSWANNVDEESVADVEASELEANWALLIGRPVTANDGSVWEQIETLQGTSLFALRNTPAPADWSPKAR